MRKRNLIAMLDVATKNALTCTVNLKAAESQFKMEHARYTSLYKDYREMEAELRRLQQDQLSAVCSSCKHSIAKTGENETGYICTVNACEDYEPKLNQLLQSIRGTHIASQEK